MITCVFDCVLLSAAGLAATACAFSYRRAALCWRRRAIQNEKEGQRLEWDCAGKSAENERLKRENDLLRDRVARLNEAFPGFEAKPGLGHSELSPGDNSFGPETGLGHTVSTILYGKN